MKHLDEVLKTVDEAIRNNVIHDMNVRLCELSVAHQLNSDKRFTNQ